MPECICVCFPTRKTDSQSDGNVETRIVTVVKVEQESGNKLLQEDRNIENVQQPNAESERAYRVREPTAIGAKVHVPFAGSHQPLAYTSCDTERHRSKSGSTEKHPGSSRK